MTGKLPVSIFVFIISLTFIPGILMADEGKEDKLAKALEKYEKTGKVNHCVPLSRVSSTKVIDDNNILFKMKGRKAYLNKLPYRCSRLGFERAFSYVVHTNQLCSSDIITVFDSTSNIQGPSCGLGKFIEYKKKPKAEKK